MLGNPLNVTSGVGSDGGRRSPRSSTLSTPYLEGIEAGGVDRRDGGESGAPGPQTRSDPDGQKAQASFESFFGASRRIDGRDSRIQS